MGRGSRIDSKGSFLFNNIINEFNEINVDNKNIKVLDFGCGSGQLASQLNLIGYATYGCDIESFWLSNLTLNGNQKQLKKITENPYTIPFPDDFFDFVISSSVMEHVHNKKEVFYEIKRVLKTGGRAIHCFPSKNYLPTEPHTQVPLLNYFLPTIPKSWLFFWAALKVRKKYGHGKQNADMLPQQVVRENIEYCTKHLCYWTNSEYEKISNLIFGNCSWPMHLYLNYAKSSKIAQICNKLPFKKITGYLISEFRMTLLVQKKTTND